MSRDVEVTPLPFDNSRGRRGPPGRVATLPAFAIALLAVALRIVPGDGHGCDAAACRPEV